MKKVTLVAVFASLLVMSACAPKQSGKNTGQESTNTQENSSKKKASSESSTSTSSTENSNSSDSSTSQDPTHPYAVGLDEIAKIGTFTLQGMNIPTKIVIQTNGTGKVTVNIEGGDTGVATIQNIKTKEIRVFTNGTNEVRTVSVNTEIPLQNGQVFYAFYNDNGGISIATPNFAGNVSEDQKDVLLEYIGN